MPCALIIGGGPAGSVAAMLLARRGWRVTLVEQHRFPRDKVCGECLSALGADVLRRLGLIDALMNAGAVRLSRTLLHAPSGTSAGAPLPRPMWGISRTVLDALLLDATRSAGAAILQPARCEGLTAGTPASVRVRDLVTNRVAELSADVVLLADGKSALLPGGAPAPTGDLGIKTHFTHVDGPRDAVELFGLAGCYAGLAPIEDGRWNCALSVPTARVAQYGGDLARLFADMVEENVTLRRRLAAARRVGGWLAAPLPRFAVRRYWPANLFPLGNAAAAIEPIGGEGMGLAMRSAELAAGDLLTGGRDRPRTTRRRFRQLWRTRGVACRAGGLLASSPRTAGAAAPFLRATPLALRAVLACIGK